jgi:predicted kinase
MIERFAEVDGEMKQVQINIGGSKRAGKTTLARGLLVELIRRGFRPVIVDSDEVKFEIFGEKSRGVKPDTPESLQMHIVASRAVTLCVPPLILKAGGSPIVTATHSRRGSVLEAKALAEQVGVPFRFILLENAPVDELIRRVHEAPVDDLSDVKNTPETELRGSLLGSCQRIRQVYADFCEEHVRISQGNPADMLCAALDFVLEGLI